MSKLPVISAAASVTGEIIANAWGGECTITAAATPQARVGADLIAACAEVSKLSEEAVSSCSSLISSCENGWYGTGRSADMCAVTCEKAATRAVSCKNACDAMEASGNADAAVVAACRSAAEECRRSAAKCALAKLAAETLASDESQEKEVRESCRQCGTKIAASAARLTECAASCDKVTAAISAESPKAPQDPPANSRAQVGAAADGGAGIKLDTPDAQGGKMDPGPRGNKIDGKDGKAPLPRFNLSAYNGGPMMLAGFKFPVVIDASGAKCASENMPIYVGHPADNAPASELMETLVGQGASDMSGGKITACGDITGTSKTVQLMMKHAIPGAELINGEWKMPAEKDRKPGFKFQNSVHGRPTVMEFVRPGETANVNGRAIVGPVVVARQSLLDHIAILPLGADTSTSAHIAAQHAAKDTNMERFAWIKANYGLDEAAFNALPETARNTISAAFDAASKAPEKKPEGQPAISAGGTVADTDSIIKAQNAAVAANQTRIASINAIDGAAGFPAITAQAITDNWSVEKAEVAIIKAQRDKLTKDSTATGGNRFGGAGNTPEFAAAFPRVLEAATLMSCGYRGDLASDRHYGEKIANMTDDFYRQQRSRVITPSTLARIVARNAGVSLPDGHGDDFWSEALAHDAICPRGGQRIINAEFSTVALPVTLSNVMNKFVLMGYYSVDPNACDPAGKEQAWKSVCRISSVQDFKPHYRLRMVASVMLQRLLKGGEIQHGTVGEQSYMLTPDTKAIQLGITRKDLINDDQGVISTLPTHFGVGAGRTVANDVWDCWLANLQSDGATAFWTASDITTVGNKMKANLTASAALVFATLEASHLRLAAQTDPTGQPAGLLGQVLLVPTALAGTALQLNNSERVPVYATTRAAAVGDNNTLRGRQKCVSSAYLQNGTIKADGTARAGSATDWFLSESAASNAYPMEIGFLNGVEAPIIERAEADFNRLGISFRTFLDYGVAMSEPRAAQKQTA